MSNQSIIVLFPGGNDNASCPLLYYAGFKYEMRGYEKIALDYEHVLDNSKPFLECLEDIQQAVFMKLRAIDFSQYDDIIFVSKSLGTVVAGWAEETLCITARHIYLTPLKETLPYLQKGKAIISVIAGAEDPKLDIGILRAHCLNEQIDLKVIDGVGHRLEVRDDMDRNIEIVKEIVALY